ncbi:MAG: hypothetical protein H6642_15295 [Caldilineaceae bacterium]|nr:hypothetical protein [Caldilineaceae bacterium]
MIPSEFQKEHLFLLVGKNPLPNAVAIDALRPENGTVYFVCTAKTLPIAEKLIRFSGLNEGRNAQLVPINDESGIQIADEVKRYATGKSSLGLNYTGGTKHMVLHAFQGIQQAAEAYHNQPVLSYLDARTLKMRVERLGSPSNSYTVTTVSGLNFSSLLEMHGYRMTECARTPIASDVYPVFAELNPKKLSRWYQKARNGKDKEAQRDIPLPDIPALTPHWGGATTVGEFASTLGVPMSEMGKWFAGQWLEDYTLASIQNISSDCGIDDSAMNLKASASADEFEFDVAALKGYQLYGFSCNAQADKKTIKQKLFEAYIRAHQMGGDEARVAVVCFAPKNGPSSPQSIEWEVRREWDEEGKVRVFGEEHLPALPQYLEQWMCQFS